MLANHCRANLLLEKEYFKLKKNPLWGIEAHPVNQDNCLNWQAVIKGPRETLWESGIFTAYISFSEEYNLNPPEIFFHTVPFHPNIDMKTGKPCIDFIDDSKEWRPCYDLVYILLNLQVMLSNPVLENPVNVEAATMLQSRPKQYRQMVLDSVHASRRFEAGLSPFIISPVNENPKDQKEATSNRQLETRQSAAQKISFEDYYKTWTSIATSRPEDISRAPLKEPEGDEFKIDQIHFGVVKDELEEELRRQLSEHNALMYGKIKKKDNRDEDRIAELKATKVQLLKQIYFKSQDLPDSYEQDAHVHVTETQLIENEDPIEDEVDKLVDWTENLPE